MKTVLTITFAVLLIGSASAQWDDFDNVPYAPGFYLQGYPGFATASKGWDADGNSQDLGGTWNSFGLGLNPVYYGMLGENRWSAGASVPFVSIGDGQSGIGDMQVYASYWVIDDHKKGSYFSVWFWADLPIGDENKGLGTGQMNIRPGVAWATEKYPYLIQASAYYNMRFEGTYSNIDIKPGNEIWGNASFDYSVNDQMSPGLEVQTGWGSDYKVETITFPDTKEQWFKVGPTFAYTLNPTTSLKFVGLYNVMGKNTDQSIDIGARITWGF